jgi:hypothetical protein
MVNPTVSHRDGRHRDDNSVYKYGTPEHICPNVNQAETVDSVPGVSAQPRLPASTGTHHRWTHQRVILKKKEDNYSYNQLRYY